MTNDTIRIFIGTEPKTEIARKVLEFSIQRRTKRQVQFVPMLGPEWEYSTKGIKVGTGFSLRRWMIPAACGWAGHALYLDADQLVLGDIGELWDMKNLPVSSVGTAVRCTYQRSRYSKEDWPHTSVMLIDCAAAKLEWCFDIHRVLEYLKKNTDKSNYVALMYGKYLVAPEPISVDWNTLDKRTRTTKLLHYTKEPKQPWYNPKHAYADLWQEELQQAILAGVVSLAEFEEALDRWKKKEDWRDTNGLHPHYKRFLKYFTRRRASRRKLESKVLWVSSCAPDMWEVSGKALVESFIEKKTAGDLLFVHEGTIDPAPRDSSVLYTPIDQKELDSYLEANRDIIPETLGGDVPAAKLCRCKGGPLDPHSKRHKMPCVGAWFCKNAFRWFRKIVAQKIAIEHAMQHGYTHVIWIDADCSFVSHCDTATAVRIFKGKDVFFLKSSKRIVAEAGVVGFAVGPEGNQIFSEVWDCYRSGRFRKMPRWDDSAVYQAAFTKHRSSCINIATGVGEFAAVVPFSPLSKFLVHDKGRHGRKLKIME